MHPCDNQCIPSDRWRTSHELWTTVSHVVLPRRSRQGRLRAVQTCAVPVSQPLTEFMNRNRSWSSVRSDLYIDLRWQRSWWRENTVFFDDKRRKKTLYYYYYYYGRQPSTMSGQSLYYFGQQLCLEIIVCKWHCMQMNVQMKVVETMKSGLIWRNPWG